jgi:hypothetical protein
LDRLYSRFPAGSGGLALLLLRLVGGVGLNREGVRLCSPTGTSSEPTSVLVLDLVLVFTALMLVLGLRTSGNHALPICVATRSPDKSVCFVRTHWYRVSQEQHKNGFPLGRFRAELPKFIHAGVQNGL